MSIAQAAQAVDMAAIVEAVRLERRDRARRLLDQGDALLGRLEQRRLDGRKYVGPELAADCQAFCNAVMPEDVSYTRQFSIDTVYDAVMDAEERIMGWLQPGWPREDEDG